MQLIRDEIKQCGKYKLAIKMWRKNGVYIFEGDLFEKDKILEKCITPSVTDDKEKADKIFEALLYFDVFPCHFNDVTDDFYNKLSE